VKEDTAAVEQQRARIMDGLRAYGRAFGELGRLFAGGLGLHSTDAVALVEIIAAEERGEPLSQSALSQRIALTAGATSTLLSRLEKRGHITRSRVKDDRRIVTLRSTPEIHRTVDQFFQPLGIRLDEMAAMYPRVVLDQIERFVVELCATMEGYIAERSQDSAGRESPEERS
jgi:DNA-binding MarR family transcriptional regulator